MKVELLSYTPDALNLLLKTKNTRLGFDSDPSTWTEEQKSAHLAYMRDTIRSSWEMIDYVFQISGVSRAFTHQLVRTRTGAYAQESQRTVDVRNNDFLRPVYEIQSVLADVYEDSCKKSFRTYELLIGANMSVQDARGVLPTATLTSIIAKFSLRTLSDMAKTRLCTRTQGEYQDVFREMRFRVIDVHPWVEEHRFMEVQCASEGTCAFPRFGKTECKFYDPRMDTSAVAEDTRKKYWAAEKQVAVPVSKNGMTMK